MIPFYQNVKDNLMLYHKKSVHVPPHLHDAIEFVLVTEGTLELGIGVELYHMEKGDFGMIFPGMVHHFQVFGEGIHRAYHMLAAPSPGYGFQEILGEKCPENPVISSKNLHRDVPYAIESLYHSKGADRNPAIVSAFVQIILARTLPRYTLTDKSSAGSNDLIYQTVTYIAAHFTESLCIESMAHDLGINQPTLSKVFSKTFHTNFNQYLNEVRLEYACSLLQYTDMSITDACMNAGFESQRTFNRVFQDKMHMSPRVYRHQLTANDIII